MGVEPFLLVSTLRVIVGQRLVRRLADDKEQYTVSAKEREKIAPEAHFEAALAALSEEKLVKTGTKLDEVPFWRPKEEDGYKSRIGIHEVFQMSTAMRELIMKEATSEQLEEQAKKEGMLTMLEDGIYKASRGITSLEEVLRAVSE
jgi:type II secretory ATPase GspE/PulE/Tfp pilus assembly ATPase PilB-like protein